MRKRPLIVVRAWLAACALAALALPARAQVDATTVHGDSDAFVEATVNIPNPWVGQQVDYLFRYYEAQDTARLPSILSGAPDYKAPAFSNFWVEGDIEQRSYQAESGGRPYDVSELHTNIFPTMAGELVIDPALLILSDLPQQGERTLSTLPVVLNVRPLPEGAPPGFSGAVGEFRLSADVDRTNTRVDEPISLRLTLSGRGNLGMASPPSLPDLPGWRVLESGSESRIDILDGLVGGVRTWDYQLIPTEAGGVEFPPLEYLFFDPATESYKGALTVPLVLTVEALPAAIAPAPSPSAAAPDQSLAAAMPVTPPVSTEPLASARAASAPAAPADLAAPADPAVTPGSSANLMTVAGAYTSVELSREAWFWALWALPLLAVVLTAGVTTRGRRAEQRSRKRRQERAAADALRALGATNKHGDATAQCAAAQRVLDEYLSRKLGRQVAGMTRAALGALLTQRGVDPALAGEVLACYGQCESSRYNPAGVSAESAAAVQERVQATIRRLEKALQP